MKGNRILLGIVIFSLILSATLPFVEGHTWKGHTSAIMDMAGSEPFYRTFYSNLSKRYYMLWDNFDADVPPNDWLILYAHSPYGYTFSDGYSFWNNSNQAPDYGTNMGSRNFAIYLEPNGRYLHTAFLNNTDDLWYRRFEINEVTGQIVSSTLEAQLVNDNNIDGSKDVVDELSITADSNGTPWISCEAMTGGVYYHVVIRSNNNTGEWIEDDHTVWLTEVEWIAEGGGNPPNYAWGGHLVPLKDGDIQLIFWWLNSGPNFERMASMWFNSSGSDWLRDTGNPFYDPTEGDWAYRAYSLGFNIEADTVAFTKQEENDPNGQIAVYGQILNTTTHVWGSKFQVGFDEAGDAGVPLFNPFCSMAESGAVNFVWNKAGNTSLWMNRMYPNGTLEGWAMVHDEEFAFEHQEFSAISGMVGDDKPMGLQYLDNDSTDELYYNTEFLYLESEFAFPAEHLNTTLTDGNGNTVEDGDWLFEGEVYTVESFVENATSFYVNTTDSRHEIIFNWDNSTTEMWISVDPADQFTIGLAHSEYERFGNITRLLWRFIPDRSIIDSEDNDWSYTITNVDMGFTFSADLGFDTWMYNLGGFTYYTFTGDGGRTPGGHPFEIFATNGSDGSSARAEQIYRKLQHVHFLIEIEMNNEWDGGNGEFDIDPGVGFVDIGIDYRLNSTWYEGFSVRLYVQDADVGHHNAGLDHDWVEWSVDWYNYDPGTGTQQNFRSGLIYSNHWGYENENLNPDYYNRTSSQLWVDLWFDRTNASTTVAGQVNALYHGMREHGSSWWFGYGDFQPMISDYGNALMLDDLYDEGGNVTDSMKFDLMRVFLEVGKVADADGDDEPWVIRAVENYNRKQADDRMMGVEQPAFEETLVLDMPMFQSMNPLIRAIDGISIAVWRGALAFQKIAWGALDSFFEWAGFGPGFFSLITSFIMMLPEAFAAYIQDLGEILSATIPLFEEMFRFFASLAPSVVQGLMWLAGSLMDYWDYFQQIMTGSGPFTGLQSIIYDMQLGDWIRAGIAVLPAYEILWICFDDKPGKRAQRRVKFYTGLFTGITKFVEGMIDFLRGAISVIMDIMPG